MKILTILGARPQFIKAGSVSREITRQKKAGSNLDEVIVHTGQHYDANMSNVFFDEMHIPKPDYFLGIGDKGHGAMTGKMIEEVEKLLLKEQPDWVLVYGDTNSTLAGALAAIKLQIKIAHVEAGLRSFNMAMPEEINRILTDRVSALLFCPTKAAVENLKNEGVQRWDTKVVLSGDVMQDGANFYRRFAEKPDGINFDKPFVLSTIHRAENTDNVSRLRNIISALNEISESKKVILPLHPRTRKILLKEDLDRSNITIINPVGYLSMVWLIENSDLVMTDSGGLQKEAYFFGKPCITLRNETEWVELTENNFNVLSGSDKERILDIYMHASFSSDFTKSFYGGGKASKRIVNELLNAAG